MSFLTRLRPPKSVPLGLQRADGLVAELVAALSPDRVRTDLAQQRLLSRDASVFDGGHAGPVCFPRSTAEVQAIMQITARHGRPVVARGAGTGLAGGAIPLAPDATNSPVVVSMTHLNGILEVDLDNRIAWVEPGVVNLDLTKHLGSFGFHFAPDPSSQQVCTIGGNVANNSGGPHCLAYGVTNAHVMAIDVVLPDGSLARLGGLDPEPLGLDLRGVYVGSEGTMGIATKIAVRISPNHEAVRTLLLSFSSVADAARTVSAIIASGIVPAALEMMDQRMTTAVENYVHAGYPTDAAAVLLAEVDGLSVGVDVDAQAIARIGTEQGATAVRMATDETQRALLWKGRKTAFGAIAQIAPDYYLHDTVVPRAKLAEVLEKTYEIAERYGVIILNVLHAGDGNLHPLMVFDARVPGMLDKVHAAGAEIITASLDAGGVLSGEHGIGIEKRAYMDRMFSDADLDHQNRLRRSFDPTCRSNPGKVLPGSHSCADIQSLYSAAPDGVWG